MPSNRHNLILDEQAFQGLLSAAFIVQEYNDRLNHDRMNHNGLNSDRLKPARLQPVEPEVRSAPESHSICRHCGAPKPTEESRCESCGRDQLRPGERLQRNWASMWLMSQEQDLWPERSPEIGESARKDVPALVIGRSHPTSALDSASSGLVAQPGAREMSGHGKPDTIIKDRAIGKSARDTSELGKSALDETTFDPPTLNPALDDEALTHPTANAQAFNQAEAESDSITAAIDPATDEATDHLTQEEFAPEDTDLRVHTFQLSASDDSSPIEAGMDDSAEASDASDLGNRSFLRHLADLRVKLRFQRSNLYLAGAVLVAGLALLWPTASSPRRAVLSPWERALVTLGLADAPEPATHLPGDPALQVWVDPHSALYYCPGEEQYGKTADGRFSSQREAQMDRFEPAGHLACE